MSQFCIATRAGDNDALIVASALEARGHQCGLWHTDQFPAHQGQSAAFGASAMLLELHDRWTDRRWKPTGTLWLRRAALEPATDQALDAGDTSYAQTMSRKFMQWLLLSYNQIEGFERVVNEPEAALRAESKLLQLVVARRAGIPLPATLVSNDPTRIRAFFDEHRGRIVRKSLRPFTWVDRAGYVSNDTNLVEAEDLVDAAPLRVAPEIFQAAIDKRAEYRVFVAGSYATAVRFQPDDGFDGMDWRLLYARPNAGVPAGADAGPAISVARTMCRELGLWTASVDVAIDRGGSPILFEVNQSGQFLWLEELGAPVLANFVAQLDGGQVEPTLTCAGVVASGRYAELLAYGETLPVGQRIEHVHLDR